MATWVPRTTPPAVVLPRRDRRLLLVVGAIAALLLVAGLVARGTVGLTRPPGERIVTVDPVTGVITSEGVELVADRTTAMFPDVHLEPGVPLSSCIELTHTASSPVDAVALRVGDTTGSSLLLDRLRVRIERGAGGVGPDCAGFVAEQEVVAGRVWDLAAPEGSAGLASWEPGTRDRTAYRFTVVLPEADATDELQGTRARVDFLWAATATPATDTVVGRTLLLALAVARDALLPLLLLAVLAVLFLGVQDRIDRLDPKLALAAVHEEPQTFRPAAAARPAAATVIDLRDTTTTGGRR